MNENYELMLEVSKRLAGEEVLPAQEAVTLQEYLMQVAGKKIERSANSIVPKATKMLIALPEEKIEEAKEAMVSAWLQFASSGKSSITKTEALKNLMSYKE